MKLFAIIAILFAASEASLIHKPIPYETYVKRGGLPMPEAFRKNQVFYEDVYNSSRIVGGQEAIDGQFPYSISLQARADSSLFCGGSILDANYVLTAAHCVYGDDIVYVRYNTRVTGSNAVGQVVASKRIKSHPSYNSNTFDNDIALIQLAESLTLDQTNAQAIKLASTEPLSGTVTAAGWGTTISGGVTLPANLLYVNVNIVPRATCEANYNSVNKITKNMICAGENGKDSCQGDSGGILINSAKEQVGIVSWGFGCGGENHPGVYTNVVQYLDWIKANTA